MKYLFVLPIRFHVRAILFAALAACSASLALAQSTDQRFPTPVRTNEIVGTIKARDVGDSRLTTYYYTFEGEQGDLFINVQSRNFTGDIDVYVMTGQRPLTKIVTYADIAENETGRVVYLRKPERLLLRIEGRSPGDEDASIRVKFAGSFAASKLEDVAEPELPKTTAENTAGIRVNSVGTIIEVIPKTKPTPDAVAEKTEERQPEPKAEEEKKSGETEAVAEVKEPEKEPEAKKTEVVVTDPLEEKKPEPAPKATTANRRNRRARNTPPPVDKAAESAETPTEPVAEAETKTTAVTGRRSRRAAAAKKEPAPDPMAGVNLVIQLKDGGVIERPMSEVLKFSVERAVLTVIHKNGTIGRYQMAEVASVTIR